MDRWTESFIRYIYEILHRTQSKIWQFFATSSPLAQRDQRFQNHRKMKQVQVYQWCFLVSMHLLKSCLSSGLGVLQQFIWNLLMLALRFITDPAQLQLKSFVLCFVMHSVNSALARFCQNANFEQRPFQVHFINYKQEYKKKIGNMFRYQSLNNDNLGSLEIRCKLSCTSAATRVVLDCLCQ